MDITWAYRSLLVMLLAIGGITAEGCNEFTCGSVVSKCLITQSCDCQLSDCFCCRSCINCLGELYSECCDCLEMCPRQNETEIALSPKSQIGDFDGIPELFITLSESEDDKWKVYQFPIEESLSRQMQATAKIGDELDLQVSTLKKPLHILLRNCTVIYLNKCVSMSKCMQNCESMGANSYRWFHDGCCECIGPDCINYGLNKSKCQNCPAEEEEIVEYYDESEEDDNSEDTWDFGEED